MCPGNEHVSPEHDTWQRIRFLAKDTMWQQGSHIAKFWYMAGCLTCNTPHMGLFEIAFNKKFKNVFRVLVCG